MRQKTGLWTRINRHLYIIRCKKLIYPADEVVGEALFQVIKCVEQGAYICNIHFTY